MIRVFSLTAALMLSSAGAQAGDCFNDDGAVIDDLEPAVLKVTDADIEALKAAIQAHETRAVATATEPASAASDSES